MFPTAAREFYQARNRLTVITRAEVRKAWRRMGPDFDASWRNVRSHVHALVTQAQMSAAAMGSQYIGDVLEETGQDAEPVAQVRPETFGGVASDGRPLDSLLFGGVVTAKQAVDAGESPTEALAQGQRWLDMAAWTQIADAARGGSAVAMVARPKVTGYVRMVNPPCCSRCAILAGRWYRTNTGFQRHPRCDCTHIPAAESMAGDFATDPHELLRNGQVNDLTKAQQQALDDGADLNRVVNARRNMDATQVEDVYRRAQTREQAIAGLKRHGFLR